MNGVNKGIKKLRLMTDEFPYQISILQEIPTGKNYSYNIQTITFNQTCLSRFYLVYLFAQ